MILFLVKKFLGIKFNYAKIMTKKIECIIKRVIIEMSKNKMLQWGYNEENRIVCNVY